jgi:hypothetical protein
MYIKTTNEIYFPHIIPTPFLDGIGHTWDNVNGGAVSIADLKIKQNSFFGGNCARLGWINEYGFYACQDLYRNKMILGFYIHDPSKVTTKGKKLVREAFPNRKVVFEIYHETVMTDKDRKNLQEAREHALEYGLAPELISHSNAEELKALIASVKSGHTVSKAAEMASPNESPILTEDAEHVHTGTILAGRAQPRQATI